MTASPGSATEIVERGQGLFDRNSHPGDVLRWAVDQVGLSKIAVATSFADTVLTHIAACAIPGVDVLFVDTGYHFPETLGLRDAVDHMYDVNVRTLHPADTPEEQDSIIGVNLFASDPDRCCARRKVEPFSNALRDYSVWASGLRRDDHNGRADVEILALDPRRDMVKLNPLAFWDSERVDAYVEQHSLMVNPLGELGYASIGCAPCTRPVAEGEDPRAGRWSGQSKTECGLHV